MRSGKSVGNAPRHNVAWLQRNRRCKHAVTMREHLWLHDTWACKLWQCMECMSNARIAGQTKETPRRHAPPRYLGKGTVATQEAYANVSAT